MVSPMGDGGTTIVWISGASSGIGAALAQSVPYPNARVISISRRPPVRGGHVAADLSDPASWASVVESFESALGEPGIERGMFLHFSGDGAPHGRAVDADPDRYAASAILNGASGPVLGQRFLIACRRNGVPATLVMCSSPAALGANRGTSHYSAGKAALLTWTAIVRAEETPSGATVFAVIPWATDTPMLRDAGRQPVETNPLSGEIAGLIASRAVAAPADVAAQIGRAIDAGGPTSPLHVGSIPPDFQRSPSEDLSPAGAAHSDEAVAPTTGAGHFDEAVAPTTGAGHSDEAVAPTDRG
jgi:benzil reductase ((S)-benzoin forming)